MTVTGSERLREGADSHHNRTNLIYEWRATVVKLSVLQLHARSTQEEGSWRGTIAHVKTENAGQVREDLRHLGVKLTSPRKSND